MPASAELWKKLKPTQRQQAMSRMTPEQKTALAQSLGYKEEQAAPVTAPAPSGPGFLDSFASMTGLTDVLHPIQAWERRKQHPFQEALRVLAGPAGMVGESLYGGGKRIGGELRDAYRGAKEGNPYEVALHALQAIPIVGAGLKQGSEQLKPYNGFSEGLLESFTNPGAIGTALGTAATVAPMIKGKSIASRVREVDPVAPLERTVRNKIMRGPMSDRMRPVNEHAYESMVNGMRTPGILPTIAEYADRTRNPLKDELQLSKAADQAGREVTGYYQEHIIDPNSDVPAGNTGKTVGDAYKRVTQINALLEPKYLSQGMKSVPAMDSVQAQALIEESSQLNSAIYDTLSQRTGLAVEKLQEINRRGAILQDLGRQFKLSYDALQHGVKGFDVSGNVTPYHPLFHLATKAVNGMRGGSEAVAGRALRRGVKNFPKGYKPLPDPETLTRYRQGVERSELAHTGSDMGRAEHLRNWLEKNRLSEARAIQERARTLRRPKEPVQ